MSILRTHGWFGVYGKVMLTTSADSSPHLFSCETWRRCVLLAIFLWLPVKPCASTYGIDWSVTAGGGTESAAGVYFMYDTVGQAMADSMSSAFDHVSFGFWAMDEPPVAKPNTMGARMNLPAQTSTIRLLANDYDEDGDTLEIVHVSSPSTQGGLLVLQGDILTYTPPFGFVGDDSFTYTISDGRGGIATATVTVTVTTGGPLALRIEVVGSTVVIQFAAVPGWGYTVQRAPDISGPWVNIDNITAPVGGVFLFIDNDPPSPMAFYRLSRNN